MANFKIHPICLGRTIRDKSFGPAYGKNPGLQLETPILAWYVTDGVNKIMVDTGGVPSDGVHKMPYYQEKNEFLEIKLAELGVDPKEIKTVILTHLHWDHMSNNHLFPNAKFYVQKAELQYAVAPIPIHEGHFDLELIFKTKYEVVDGDLDILEGISLLMTPGHTPGSQTVILQTEAGRYAITGDFIALYECWESKPYIAGGIHTDLVEYYESFRKLEKACDFVLPGHEYKVLEHQEYPY